MIGLIYDWINFRKKISATIFLIGLFNFKQIFLQMRSKQSPQKSPSQIEFFELTEDELKMKSQILMFNKLVNNITDEPKISTPPPLIPPSTESSPKKRGRPKGSKNQPKKVTIPLQKILSTTATNNDDKFCIDLISQNSTPSIKKRNYIVKKPPKIVVKEKKTQKEKEKSHLLYKCNDDNDDDNNEKNLKEEEKEEKKSFTWFESVVNQVRRLFS